MVIFDEYDPLAFGRDQMRDYFATSMQWARQAHQQDPQARYMFWGWNGGLKGGASIPHAHAQIGLGRRQHYAQIQAEWNHGFGASDIARHLGVSADSVRHAMQKMRKQGFDVYPERDPRRCGVVTA